MKHYSIYWLLALFFLVSCNSGQQQQQDQQEEASSEEIITLTGPAEKSLYLSIVETMEQDTAYVYNVQAMHDGELVGFHVSLDKDIPAGLDEMGAVLEDDGFKTGTIKFLRSGEESDRFIQALASYWGMEVEESTFSNEPVLPLVFSSNKSAASYDKPATHNFKLFFHPDVDEPGEMFFTHDTYLRRVEFQEKDSTYREEILRALRGVQAE